MTSEALTAALLILFCLFTPAWALDAAADAQEREEELYEEATEHLDQNEWRQAAQKYAQVARMGQTRADAALYWQAYAQNRMGQRSEALSTIVDLQKRFPNSKYTRDAKALEVEIRQSAGQRIEPDKVEDEDLKLMAVNGLMHSDPERAIPILEKIINSNQSPKVKDKALFVLSHSGSPKAMEILGRIARDGSRPELQARAIKNLGLFGGEASRQILHSVYTSSNDLKVKRSILKSYMVSGDRGRLLSLAKSEQNPELRSDAVQQLGILGARNELSELYATETSIPVRKKIIHAMFLGGNGEKLAELARNEKVPELRHAAIKNLGLLGGERSAALLVSLYDAERDVEVRQAIIQGLFIQGNARQLVALARKEKDPALKKKIVQQLSVMNSPEATDYLLEILGN